MAQRIWCIIICLAFTGIFAIIADLGLSTLIVREISRNKNLAKKYIGNFLSVKIILSLFTFGLIVLFINLIGYPHQIVIVVYLIALSSILNSLFGIFYSFFQSYEILEYQSIGQIFNSVLMFLGIFIGILIGTNIIGISIVYFLSSLITLIYIIIIFLWKFYIPKLSFNLNFWKNSIKEALPFGITSFSGVIYTYIDSVMLSLIQGNEVVGWYNAAYKLILVLLFIPGTINITLFPSMSKLHISSKDSLKLITEKYFKLMLIISIPLGTAITILADEIIIVLFGFGYQQSVIALQILVWTIVFTFVGAAFVRLLEASNRQVIVTKISLICVIVNILLNLILIPKFSYVGACIATVITEIILVSGVIKMAYKIGFGISTKKIVGMLLKVTVSTTIMGVFLIYFKDFNLLILIPSVLLYIFILYLIKGIDDTDINLLKQMIKRQT